MDQKKKLWRKNSGLLTNHDEKEKIIIMEKSLDELKGNLSIARMESNAKDELLNKQSKVAQEAIFGWKKAESEVLSLKDQIKQNFAKLKQQDEILSETTKNLSIKGQNVKDLEEKLTESNDKVSILSMENKNLYAILETKETIIKELNESNDKASLTEIRARFSSCDKENSNLKYELCMVQKELEIRNKEREYNIKTAEAAYKQQTESMKKVSQLENECNKLRLMVRKRLPSYNAFAKMRNEVENFGTNSNIGIETRRKKPSPDPLVTKLHVIEEENKVLKETLAKKNCEDTLSCAESWASALINELENYKSEKIEGSNSNYGSEVDQFESYPSWLKDIVRVIIGKHYVIQKSVESIIEEVIDALRKSGFYRREEKKIFKCAPESLEIDLNPSEEVKSGFSTMEANNLNVYMENCRGAPEKMETTEKPYEMDGSHELDLEANERNEGGNNESNEIERENVTMAENKIVECESNLKFQKEMKEEQFDNGLSTRNRLHEFKDEKKSFEFESKSQLESDITDGNDTFVSDQDDKQLRTESESTSSTEKLAECQETILNLSKQLQEMSDQENISISDQKDASIAAHASINRSVTLSQIIAEEKEQLQESNENAKLNEIVPANLESSAEVDEEMDKDEGSVPVLVPKRRKAGISLLGRIIFRKKEKRDEA